MQFGLISSSRSHLFSEIQGQTLGRELRVTSSHLSSPSSVGCSGTRQQAPAAPGTLPAFPVCRWLSRLPSDEPPVFMLEEPQEFPSYDCSFLSQIATGVKHGLSLQMKKLRPLVSQ